ncbi:ATP-binding protein [Paenibacillus sp. J2TS4]|uniref:ATP-binding protein n=1 Tax=Paenibacillus sp. J2TS4 TaxID=2807194 RepID=UPI001BCFB7D5|nr:ATP-binding protein [Paenibacillus sp. J2TS4]
MSLSNKLFRILILLFVALWFCSSYVHADQEGTSYSSMELTEWEYHWGDFPIDSYGNLMWESGPDYKGIPNDYWLPAEQTVNPPDRGERDILWLRAKLPTKLWKDPSLLVRIYENFRIYINGQMIYQFGQIGNARNVYQGTPERIVPLPSELMGEMIYIKVYSSSQNIGIIEYPTLAARSDFILGLLKQQADRIILGCFYILAGLLSLYPYYKLRLKPFLSFSMFSVSFGLYTICRTTIIYFYYDAPMVWMYLELISLIGGTASALLLLTQLFEEYGIFWWMKVLCKIHLLYAFVFLPAAYFGAIHWLTGLYYYQLLLFVTMAVTILYLTVLSIKRNREAQIVLCGTVCFSVAGTIDILDNMLFRSQIPSISYLGMLGLVLCLVIVLIRKSLHLINRLRNTEKLSLVGQLAAGIAHEIRNPLTVISGNLQLMNQQHSRGEMVPLMLEEVNRINGILNELLYLARTQPPHFEENDLLEVLHSVVALFQGQPSEPPVYISLQSEKAAVPVSCDANRLKQVFINILKNGIEAMPDGGRLDIVVTPTEKEGAQIHFIDEGIGIAAKELPRLSIPFYTTKANGTGLGLAISRKIIEDHGGQLSLFSRPNQGTIVEVRLPACPTIG